MEDLRDKLEGVDEVFLGDKGTRSSDGTRSSERCEDCWSSIEYVIRAKREDLA